MGGDPILPLGDPTNTQTGMPVILSASQSSVTSDANGFARFVPAIGSFTGLLEVEIQVSAGTAATLEEVMESFPESAGGNGSTTTSVPRHGVALRPVEEPMNLFDDLR